MLTHNCVVHAYRTLFAAMVISCGVQTNVVPAFRQLAQKVVFPHTKYCRGIIEDHLAI